MNIPRPRPTIQLTCILLGAMAGLLGSPSSATSWQQVRFEASISRVRVNVIVTDGAGRFVDDLRPEDFVIHEDGQVREVIQVQLIDMVAGKVATMHQVSLGVDAAGAEEPRDSRAGLRAGAGRGDPASEVPASLPPESVAARFGAIVFFIDFLGLDHVTKLHFTNQWEKYLRDRETTALPQAVYLVDQLGVLREIAPLTTDMQAIRAAQQTVEAMPLTSRYSAAEGESGARQEAFMEYDRAMYSFRLLTQFCDALYARPGRTALVWVSAGLDLKAGLHGRGFGPNARLLEMQDDLVVAANSANVSIYSVDPSRLIDLFGGDPSGTRAGSLRDELGDTLRFTAAETGGERFIAWADFGRVVNTIENDSARYYLLTYAGPSDGGDGEYHAIRVEVARAGVEVRSTQGYADLGAEERHSRFVSAALTLPGTVNELPVTAEISLGEGDRRRADVRVAVTVAGDSVGVQTDEEGRSMQRVEVHGVLLDADRQVAAEMHREVTEYIGGNPISPVEALVSRHRWQIAPGRYELRVMVIDDATGRVGTAVIEVEARPAQSARSASVGSIAAARRAGR